MQSPIHTYLEALHAEIAGLRDGQVASYIPELAKGSPDWFGICLVTVDGVAYGVGDIGQPFTIQSISKAFVYAASLADRGKEYVFRTRDLSTSGLFLYSRISHTYPFKVGSRLKLELFDYDKQVSCTVVVARIVQPGTEEAKSYPTGFAVKIVQIEEAARVVLGAMIDRVKEQGAAY